MKLNNVNNLLAFLFENEDSFLKNFGNINRVITQEHSKEIRDYLIEMFPEAKEVIDYQYNDEAGQPFAEWRRMIWEIKQYKLHGPKSISPNKLIIDPSDYQERLDKFNQYVSDKEAGRPAQYFRSNTSDPREIDFAKLPPLTLQKVGNMYEVIDGLHRAFLAKINNKDIRAFYWEKQNNNHPNVEKIKALFNVYEPKTKTRKSDPNQETST